MRATVTKSVCVTLSHTKEKQRGNTTRAGMDEAGGVADLERASRFSTEGRNGSCPEQALLDLRDCHRMMIAVGGAWADEAACWIAYWGRMQWGRGGVIITCVSCSSAIQIKYL